MRVDIHNRCGIRTHGFSFGDRVRLNPHILRHLYFKFPKKLFWAYGNLPIRNFKSVGAIRHSALYESTGHCSVKILNSRLRCSVHHFLHNMWPTTASNYSESLTALRTIHKIKSSELELCISGFQTLGYTSISICDMLSYKFNSTDSEN
jgi:hypothetical protein